jgi:hypothetical protein
MRSQLALGFLVLLTASLARAGAPAGIPPSLLEKAQQHISEREYWASANPEGLQAPNREHNLRTYFDADGVRVHDRTAPGAPALMGMKLTALGRGDALEKVEPGTLWSEQGRVEIRRPSLVEWYVNTADGLEQGFTLAKRPAGPEAEPLRLALSLDQAKAKLRGDAVTLTTATGRKLRYDKLVVRDASGAEVDASFEVPAPDRVQLVVRDAKAKYPLVIDPILTESADTQLDPGVASVQLGTSVAGAGDVNGDGFADVIVGAPGYDSGETNEGAAFIFHGGSAGIADQDVTTANTQLESDQAGAALGISVSGAGDVNGDGYDDVIVGAYLYDAGSTDEGAAFVFLGGSSGVADGDASTALAQLESNLAGSQFGLRVAAAGDVNGGGYADVIVGAPNYDDGQAGEGFAFIFVGGPSGTADGNPATAATEIESNQAGANLGSDVAAAGDVNGDGYGDVIIGVSGYDSGETDEGVALIFYGSNSGIADGTVFTGAATFIDSDLAGALFGLRVAGAGDVNADGYADVIVGAPLYAAGQTNEGAAFIFHGASGGIPDGDVGAGDQDTQLESNQASAFFGNAVDGAGDVNGDGIADVIVGASSYDVAGQSNAGGAYVFLGSASGVADANPSTAFASLEATVASTLFGTSVAGAGDVNGDGHGDVIVGAPTFVGTDSGGGAFVYHGSTAGVYADGDPSTAFAQIESDQANQVGLLHPPSAAYAGDVNGDGYGDVVLGFPFYDNGETDEGAAFVFEGSASGLSDMDVTAADAQLDSDQAGAQFGYAVGSLDSNGDGYSDVVVGAPYYDLSFTDQGIVFLYRGSSSGLVVNPWQQFGLGFGAAYGSSVGSAGDVNGDGFEDMINGLYSGNFFGTGDGVAVVRLGSSSGIDTLNLPNGYIEADQAGAGLLAVSSAGDVNGDGYGDILIGCYAYDNGQTDEGAVFVFHGSSSGIGFGLDTTDADAMLEGDQAGAYFGISLDSAGNVNGDQYSDVIVGAPYYDAGSTDEGAAFVFTGGSSGLGSLGAGSAHAQLESNQGSAFLGWQYAVAGVGDVDGDGYSDVVVGAPSYDAGSTDEGAAWLFLGSSSGIADGNPGTAAAQFESNQTSANLGGVSAAGDVNGDGYADFLTYSPAYDAGETDESVAFLFLGNNNTDGRSLLVKQLRGGSSTVVQPWGKSVSSSAYKVSVNASHPAGTGRVRLQIQTCAAGLAFGHGSCTTTNGSWTDVDGGSPEAVLTETVGSLSSGTLYHWRARVQHAPATGTIPSNPGHGPWLRVGGQAVEADVRVAP